jgi:ATP-dependent RNA helicase RhlE
LFAALGLDPRLLEGIRDLGFTDTRAIQSAVIPLAIAGDDLIACAETGSGKTCAFVVPMLQRMLAETGGHTSKSRVLVLAPTRELAVQIEDEIHGLSYHTSLTSAAVYGGVEMGGQERALKAGVDIIVATPGRLIDHMRQQNADLSSVELLILDEADRMMDMGFWPDVRRIIAALPVTRQTLLFSATMPDDVVRSALEIVREPKYVQVGQRSAPACSVVRTEGGMADRASAAARRPRADLLAHENRRGQAGAPACRRRREVRGAPRGSHDGSAPAGRRGVQGREI